MKHIYIVSLLWVSAAAAIPVPAQEKKQTTSYTLPRYDVLDTTMVETRAMTLSEIIERCTRGERTKLAGHKNMTYSARTRTIVEWPHKKREVTEDLWLMYEEDTGYRRSVLLNRRERAHKFSDGEWEVSDEDKESDIRVSFSDNESTFTDVPFYLESVDDFSFDLVDTTLLEDRVIYEIAFTPKSDFKPLPSGTVFVDTKNFHIVHEIFMYEEGHNPMPLVISDIRRISRQWTMLPGGEWVADRLAIDLGLRKMFGIMPQKVRMGIELDDYSFDQGYDPRKFGAR